MSDRGVVSRIADEDYMLMDRLVVATIYNRDEGLKFINDPNT